MNSGSTNPGSPPRLILASQSKYRRELLGRLGVPFECIAPNVDETDLQESGADPATIARDLARAKARAVAAIHPDALVIGSDQVAELEGTILSKPGTAENARAQLARMAGREHRLWTAVAIECGGEHREHLDITRLGMRPLASEEIARYVAADRPLDCAGSYKVESLGITLFERIESADHTAIVGLPLLFVAGTLRSFGWCLP